MFTLGAARVASTAAASSSLTLLVARHDDDLTRALSIAGVCLATVVAAAVWIYGAVMRCRSELDEIRVAVDARMSRTEKALARIVELDRDILTEVQRSRITTLN